MLLRPLIRVMSARGVGHANAIAEQIDTIRQHQHRTDYVRGYLQKSVVPFSVTIGSLSAIIMCAKIPKLLMPTARHKIDGDY